MNIHYDIAALARVEHERRLADARLARLVKEAERRTPRRPTRWSLALRLSRRSEPRHSLDAARPAAAPQPG